MHVKHEMHGAPFFAAHESLTMWAMAPRKKPHHDRAATHLRAWRKFRHLSRDAAAERVDIDGTTLVYDRLRAANKDVQDRAMAVLDALLKAG